jgi:Arc/MetJ family transcription regulator
MRTNIVINDQLMLRALKSGRYRTKKAAVEEGLRLLVQVNSQRKLRDLKGKIHWEGDLEAMRRD